jgi:hypothetical protein
VKLLRIAAGITHQAEAGRIISHLTATTVTFHTFSPIIGLVVSKDTPLFLSKSFILEALQIKRALTP